ncbi:uncharacterized protein LOC142214475 [Leptodactylus fuscus]|uniref:uncharacterized protein LOC142214475 n=1 Tax=Leptodactylus fuscus TaxID=238119 RepID=UPI003F4E5BCC
MWKSLTLALDDDHNQTVSLQPLSECIQWVKQQRCNKGPEWSPGDWGNEIESLFENHIKKHNPKFDLKKGLNQCLVELHENISESLRRREQFPEILTAVYLKCLHNELFNHLKSLVNENLQYEDHVLLYKWAHKEHSRLCVHRVGSEDFDHLQYGNWFLDSGNKIASTGRNAMYKTLVEILQSEIVWNSYPKEKVPYYFSDVLEEGTKICKAVEDLGHSLVCRLQSLFWEEFLHFVTRYEAFLTEKLAGLITENGICIGIRIVKNCCILRNTIQNLGAEPQNLEIQGIRSLLGQCEKEGVDLILSSLKPSLKETFQNYFKNNCIEYENVLKNIKTMLIKEGIHNDQNKLTISE